MNKHWMTMILVAAMGISARGQDAPPPAPQAPEAPQAPVAPLAKDSNEAEKVQRMIDGQQKTVDEMQKRIQQSAHQLELNAKKLVFMRLNSDQSTPIRYRGVQGWWSTVDEYSRMTNDPTAMAVASVLQATELLKPRGANAQIEYFETLLPQVKNETVGRAIRLQLIDAYKLANNQDKALDELQTLITSAPKSPEAK
jgi:hypothetical protein